MQIFSCLKRNDVDIFGVLYNCPTLINLMFFTIQKMMNNTFGIRVYFICIRMSNL